MVHGKHKIRFMKPEEVNRVNDLMICLQQHQKMIDVPRLPSYENSRNELTHRDSVTGELRSNCKGTFVIVACDTERENKLSSDHVVGYLIYTQAFSIKSSRYFWVNSFFIEEGYRSKGLGRKMVDFMRLHGLATGNRIVDIPYMKNNHAGQRFYSRYGSRPVSEEYLMVVRKIE